MIFCARKTYALAHPLTKQSNSGCRPGIVELCRRAYFLKISEAYSTHLLKKDATVEGNLCEDYVSYLNSLPLPDDERDNSKRLADEEQRQQLTDCCTVCGSKNDLNAHHVIPHSEGGPTAVWNLVMLCKRCHKVIPDIQYTVYQNSAEVAATEDLLDKVRERVNHVLQTGDTDN